MTTENFEIILPVELESTPVVETNAITTEPRQLNLPEDLVAPGIYIGIGMVVLLGIKHSKASIFKDPGEK